MTVPTARHRARVALFALIAAVLGGVATGITHQVHAAGLALYVGYADTVRASANTFPTPWSGSPNTTFIGSGSPWDAGAIRLVNTGTTAIDVSSVSVDLHHAAGGASGPVFNLWGSFSVPANGQAVLTQTSQYNFDTSDFPFEPCGTTAPKSDPRIPSVTVTTSGSATTLQDTAHVLDTGGFDVACNGNNESTQWSQIGTDACAGSMLTATPASQTQAVGSNATVTATYENSCSQPLSGVDVAFDVTSGPNNGTHDDVVTDTNGVANFKYTSAQTGTDSVQVSVTNPAGTIDANPAVVVWIMATPHITTNPSPSVPSGGSVSDSATVTGGDSPTGSVTFSLYGPGDTQCMSAIATSMTALSGGSATSSAVTTTTPGTYNWVAVYSGDTHNMSVSSSCGSESVSVTPQVLTGRAYALAVDANLLGLPLLTIGPLPDTGFVSVTSASSTYVPCVASLSGILTVHALCARVTTQETPSQSTATASLLNASVALPSVPVITIGLVHSKSTTTCTGSHGATTIAYLEVGDTVVIAKPTRIKPNTHITLGVISLVLNEQIPLTGADHGLTVNAIHISVNALVATADIVIASSESDIGNCP